MSNPGQGCDTSDLAVAALHAALKISFLVQCVFLGRCAVTLQTYFAEVGHDLIGAALEECCCLLARPYANDQAETAGASCSNASRGVLEHDSASWRYAETPSGFEEHVSSGLSGETETVKIYTIDSSIKERGQMHRRAGFHRNGGWMKQRPKRRPRPAGLLEKSYGRGANA